MGCAPTGTFRCKWSGTMISNLYKLWCVHVNLPC
jgi:hypothetical protein